MTPAHFVIALATIILFSVNILAAKVGATQSPPVFFSAVRFALVVLILLPFVGLRGLRPRLVATALIMGLHFLLLFLALATSKGVGPVAVGLQLLVPFSAALGAIFRDERLAPVSIAGIVLAVLGVGLMGFDPVVLERLSSLALVVAAAFAQAVATLLMRGLQGVPPLRMQLWIALISVLPLALVSFFFESGQGAVAADASPTLIAALLFTVIGGSILAHSGLFFLIQRYRLVLATSLTMVVPVVATGLSAVFLDEVLTWRIVLGGLITLFGVALVQFRRSIGT